MIAPVIYKESMSIQVNHDIPYFEINNESVIGLAKVIQKARKIERD